MPGRHWPGDLAGYRFGFNGKENDNEVHGATGTFQDYGMRAYDTRVGRFFSVDPIAAEYPWYTPYQFAGNTPIMAVDLDGKEPDVIVGEEFEVRDGPKVYTYYKLLSRCVKIRFHAAYRTSGWTEVAFDVLGLLGHASVMGQDVLNEEKDKSAPPTVDKVNVPTPEKK